MYNGFQHMLSYKHIVSPRQMVKNPNDPDVSKFPLKSKATMVVSQILG